MKRVIPLLIVLALLMTACDGQPTSTAAPTPIAPVPTAIPQAVPIPTTAPSPTTAPTTAPTAAPPQEEQFVWPATVEYQLGRGKLILEEHLPKPDIAGWNAFLELAPALIEPNGEIRIGVAEMDPYDFVACDYPWPDLNQSSK